MTKGSEALKQWLSSSHSPSQRKLGQTLPRLKQPTISRHARGDASPSLRAVLLYEVMAGIPPEQWLDAPGFAELPELRDSLRLSARQALGGRK